MNIRTVNLLPAYFRIEFADPRRHFSNLPLSAEQDFLPQWNRPHADRHYAAALWMVWSGRVHSREVDA